jgi:hypothetical protein
MIEERIRGTSVIRVSTIRSSQLTIRDKNIINLLSWRIEIRREKGSGLVCNTHLAYAPRHYMRLNGGPYIVNVLHFYSLLLLLYMLAIS